MSDTKPVIDTSEAPTFPFGPESGDARYGARLAPLAKTLGLSKLGAMMITVEPGKRAFPFHSHVANDELFLVLEGEGELRFGETRHALKPGSIAGCPAGGPETAHQIINTGTVPLRYLAISSAQDPDIAEFPDSGKFAALAVWPGTDFFTAHMRHIGKREDARDYWEGEA